MNDIPKVSVLMSVYNDAHYLREAIDSILNQTFTNFEFIIVDDGSTDETPSILDSYTDSWIVRLHNKVNLGLTKSLNRGLSIAKGEYIARQDANDISLPDRIAKQLSFMEANPQIAAMGTDFIRFWQESGPESYIQMPQTDSQIRQKVFYEHVLCHAGAMLKHSDLQAIGGYDETFELAQDRDLWLRLLEYSKLANLSEPLYKVRMISGSITTAKRAKQRGFSQRAVLAALKRGVLQPGPVSVSRFYWQAALDEFASDNETNAVNFLRQAMIANSNLVNDNDHLIKVAVIKAFETGPAGLSHNKSRDDMKIGLSFLNEFFALLPLEMHQLKQHYRQAVAELQAAYAFTAFRQENYAATLSCSLQAWLKDPLSQLPNLGLTSITVRSLWRLLQQ